MRLRGQGRGRIAAWILSLSGWMVSCASLLTVDDVRYGATENEAGAGVDGTPSATGDGGGCIGARTSDPSCRVAAAPDSDCTRAAGKCATETLVVAPDASVAADGAIAPTAYTFPFGIAVDDSYVYWATQDDYNGHSRGALRRAAKDRAGPAETLAVEQNMPMAIAADGEYVYWFTAGQGPLVQRLSRCAPACDGGSCVSPEVIASNSGPVLGWWLSVVGRDAIAVGTDTRLYSYHKEGGSWLEDRGYAFGSDQFPTFARATDAYYVTLNNSVDHLNLLFQRDWSASFASGETLSVRSDCTNTYLVRIASKDVLELLPDGGAVAIGAGNSGLLYATGVDDKFLYLGYANDGGLWRIAKDGSRQVELLATGSVWALAVDETAVYWGDHGSRPDDFHGEIRRLVK